jgi:hypothetical protein
MTDEEKMYCSKILSQYETAPEFEEKPPTPLVEYWDQDKTNEYMQLAYKYIERVRKFAVELGKQYEQNPQLMIEHLIPCIFRACRDLRIVCNPYGMSELVRYIGEKMSLQKIDQTEYLQQTLGCIDVLGMYSFDYPAFIFKQTSNLENIKGKLLWCIDDYTRRDLEKRLDDVSKERLRLVDENNTFFQRVASDITKMLHAVETKTVYRDCQVDLDTIEFGEFFTSLPDIGKKSRINFVENENFEGINHQEPEVIISVLVELKRKKYTGFASPRGDGCRLSRRAPNSGFEKCLTSLTKEVLLEICEFFTVNNHETISVKALVDQIQQIFKDLPEADTQYDSILQILSSNNQSLKELLESRPKSIEFEDSKKGCVAEKLYTYLSNLFITLRVLSTEKVRPEEKTVVSILGTIAPKSIGWFVKLFDKKWEKQKNEKIRSRIPLTDTDQFAYEIALQFAERYSKQIEQIDDKHLEFFAEKSFNRMRKQIAKGEQPTLQTNRDLVAFFIRSVYLINDSEMISTSLNEKKWNVNGIFIKTSMRSKSGRIFMPKDRDDKYGQITVDDDELELRESLDA